MQPVEGVDTPVKSGKDGKALGQLLSLFPPLCYGVFSLSSQQLSPLPWD